MYKISIRLLIALFLLWGCTGSDRSGGIILGKGHLISAIKKQDQQQREASALLHSTRTPSKTILFGDLHVHSTWSLDALMTQLPIFDLESYHPPALACDFARFCSRIDFFALTDHAESLTTKHWNKEKDLIRQCNISNSDTNNADLVAWIGWEWTQKGLTPATHWGNQHLVFRHTADRDLPARPINAYIAGTYKRVMDNFRPLTHLKWVDPFNWRTYSHASWFLNQLERLPSCPDNVASPDNPLNCLESAPSPARLYQKLDEWGNEVLVIPHGSAWGFHTPPRTSWDKMLTRELHQPQRHKVIEIISNNGSSEEYRPWVSGHNNKTCPSPTKNYLPCCHQAGEIMRQRCGDLSPTECNRRVETAKQYALEAGLAYNKVFPDARAEEWLNCGQCEDCFKPAYNYVPTNSVQYALALSHFSQRDNRNRPLRYRFGFVAGSDSHNARPGVGYKQFARRELTMATGARSSFFGPDGMVPITILEEMEDPRMPQRFIEGSKSAITELERITSFLYAGGLTAVHVQRRSREHIWKALYEKEVYATSGPRILLWFDLLNAPGGAVPMGAEVEMTHNPEFEVRAIGDFKQKSGCGQDDLQTNSPQYIRSLCSNECYHPSTERHLITRIEVIRIRPQSFSGEEIGGLIDDVWRTFECPPDPQGCVIRFRDDTFTSNNRNTLYYVRALQEETPAINGGQLHTKFDENGQATQITNCYGDYRTDLDDDCLSPIQERAWSSPIYIDRPN